MIVKCQHEVMRLRHNTDASNKKSINGDETATYSIENNTIDRAREQFEGEVTENLKIHAAHAQSARQEMAEL